MTVDSLRYRGYTAEVRYDDEAKQYYGRVLDTRDRITFHAASPALIAPEFHTSVDEYLAYCAETGREPAAPYSGELRVRTTPERHRQIAQAAARAGKSVEAWVDEALALAAERS